MNYKDVLTKKAAPLDLSSLKKVKQAPAKVQEAWNLAPAAGAVGGAMVGVPAGLLAGAGTYGLLSLFPALKKRRGAKLLAALLAGAGGGIAAGIPSGKGIRDIYWNDQTGLPSPWKTYTHKEPRGFVSVNPAKLKFDFGVDGQKGSATLKPAADEALAMINSILSGIKKSKGGFTAS